MNDRSLRSEIYHLGIGLCLEVLSEAEYQPTAASLHGWYLSRENEITLLTYLSQAYLGLPIDHLESIRIIYLYQKLQCQVMVLVMDAAWRYFAWFF